MTAVVVSVHQLLVNSQRGLNASKYVFFMAALAVVLLPTLNLAFCQDATSQQDKPAASAGKPAAQSDTIKRSSMKISN